MAITLVGDINQTLYRFAGASPSVLSEQVEAIFPDLQTYFLGRNYRSTRQIVATSMANIAHNYAAHGGPYSDSILLNLFPRDDAPEGAPVSFRMFEDADTEAEAVANEINNLIESGEYGPDAFFVGSRTKNQLGYIENALNAFSIPFINITGGSFWTSLHVRRLTNYLALAVDETNNDAFKTVYNIASAQNVSTWGKNKGQYCQTRYLGQAFLNACGDSYRNAERAASNWKFRDGVSDLTWFVEGVQYILDKDGHVAALREIVDNCLSRFILTDEGIAEGDEAEDGKLNDLETVIAMAASFESAASFLAHVNEMREIAARAAEKKDWTGLVVLSTIHRLKGLERNVVFGIGCGEGFRKVGKGNNRTTVPAGLLPHTFSLANPPQMGVLPAGGRSPIEDERCIFHVLVSRAKDLVFLSAPATYQTLTLHPSRFVREIGLA